MVGSVRVTTREIWAQPADLVAVIGLRGRALVIRALDVATCEPCYWVGTPVTPHCPSSALDKGVLVSGNTADRGTACRSRQ